MQYHLHGTLGQADWTLGQADWTLGQADWTLGQADWTLGQADWTFEVRSIGIDRAVYIFCEYNC